MKSNQSNVVSSYHQWYEFICYLFVFFFSFIPPSIMSSILHPLDHKPSYLLFLYILGVIKD